VTERAGTTTGTAPRASADEACALLVNSTDSYADCWIPFFTLFREYWPEPYPPIVLNTETKEFRFPGLDIRCSAVGRGPARRTPTWSESLARCLATIDDDIVLYMQEDYFISGPVDTATIARCAALMRQHELACIRLMECGGAGPWSPSEFDGLWNVDRKADYRVSLQAGLWNTRVLSSYLRKHEDATHFEVYGSRRASRSSRDRILCVDRDVFTGQRQVIPYSPTGIVKGKWNRGAVVDLFADHGIAVDFGRRGFYTPGDERRSRASLAVRIRDRLRSAI